MHFLWNLAVNCIYFSQHRLHYETFCFGILPFLAVLKLWKLVIRTSLRRTEIYLHWKLFCSSIANQNVHIRGTENIEMAFLVVLFLINQPYLADSRWGLDSNGYMYTYGSISVSKLHWLRTWMSIYFQVCVGGHIRLLIIN